MNVSRASYCFLTQNPSTALDGDAEMMRAIFNHIVETMINELTTIPVPI